jgi:hypothetical protein
MDNLEYFGNKDLNFIFTFILLDWSMVDFGTISVQELANMLEKFYCEVRPEKQGELYHRNTLVNIRGAINSKLANLKRNIDIVRDTEFKTANGVLDGLLKERVKEGTSKSTKHKDIIETEEMEKIATYFKDAPRNLIILRQCVYFQLAIHFVSRGQEFHYQLQQNSFKFCADDTGEYVTLDHETHQKNHQGGLQNVEMQSEKRIYATGGITCPVAMLKLLMEKTDPSAKSLFNQYDKNAVISPTSSQIWYVNKPLAKNTFKNFMQVISQSAGLTKTYTGHCIRATSIQLLNDCGYDSRHIMLVERSHRYRRKC